MVSTEDIERIFNNVLSQKKAMSIKCKPPIDETAFDNLRTNEEVAEFFGLEYYPKGRPDIDTSGANEQFGFYDKRNHCMITFYTDEGRRINGLDFTNNHVDGADDDYVANVKDVIRAYYEAPYSLKKATWLMEFENGNGTFTGGDCSMYGIGMYRPSLWTDVKMTMYHEMSHAFAFQSIDWRNGEEQDVGQLPKQLRDKWEKATQQDYEYQRKNNLMHQDTSEYGETNPNEDFAEMGTVISCKLTKSDYKIDSAYRVYTDDSSRESGRRYDHSQTVDEIIEANPNRAKLMRELIGTGKNVDMDNKREYMNSFYDYMEDEYGEEHREAW